MEQYEWWWADNEENSRKKCRGRGLRTEDLGWREKDPWIDPALLPAWIRIEPSPGIWFVKLATAGYKTQKTQRDRINESKNERV